MKKLVYALTTAVFLLCRTQCAKSEYEETFYIRPLTQIPWTMAGNIPHVQFPREMNYTITFSRGQTSLHLVKQELTSIIEQRIGHHYHHVASTDDLQTASYTGTHQGTVLTLGCHEMAGECLLHGSLYLDGNGWQIIPVKGQLDRYRAVLKEEEDLLRVSTLGFYGKFGRQHEKSAFQHSSSFQSREVENERAKYHRIVKRQTETTECNIIEMVAVADNTVWEFFLEKENGIVINAVLAIYEYYEALFSEVDFRYAHLEDILCIRVYLIDVEIQRTEAASWSNARSDGFVIGVSGVVQCGTENFANADLVACFTRDDIELFGDPDVSGAAFIDSICTPTEFLSLMAEDLHDGLATEIAKLILVQLGVGDDGDIGCDDEDGFIGSALDIIPGRPFEFSNCSTDAIVSKIQTLNTANTNCLLQGRITDEQFEEIAENRKLAGEIIMLDDQCQVTFGVDSMACLPQNTSSIIETEDICTLGVFCTVNGICVNRTRVYNGSPCGCGQFCLKGNCTEDTSVPIGGKCRDDCNCEDVNGVCVFFHEDKGICQCGDGTQEGNNGTCINDCGAVPDTPGGNYILDSGDTVFGATATLVCLSGFSTSMTITINCTDDGWSDPTKECSLIDCGTTPNVTDGNYVTEGSSGAGAIAVLVCSENYRANSTDTCISCTNEGVWSDPSAECVRDCGRLPLTSDGYFVLDSDDTTEGATATLVCCDGYETSSNVTIVCENTDEGWSYPSETCEKKDCGGALPTVNNGTYVANDGTEFGDVAVLVCDDGYTPVSTETCISCLYTGFWSSPLTSCLRNCGVPPEAEDGYYVLTETDNTTEGATAELVCCEGYNTSMTVMIICEDTKQGWSHPAETCTEIDCGSALPMVNNGTYIANDGTEFGDVAVLVCDDGYTPMSTETCISCLYIGFWSSPLTSCQRDCGVPPVAEDGYYILTDSDNTTEGATAELTCCEGFNTSMTVTIICEDTDQGWSYPAKNCTEIDCGSILPTVDNGTYIANDGTEFGDVAVLVCDDGFIPMSTETCISCLYTGSWSSPLTSCLRDCGVPPVAQDGYYILTDSDNTTEEATAELVCCEGFNTSITVTITCEDTAQGWSSPAESCTKTDCGKSLPTVDNGTYVANDGTEFGDVAVLVCDDGYTPTSTETCISCLYTGSWSSPLSSCQRDCGVPPVAEDGYYILTDTDNTTEGATAELICCEGYNTSMTVTIICEDTEQGWSDPAETCTEIDCGSVLPSVNNGTYVANDGTEFGDVAVLVCDDGYTPVSTETCISCLYTGSWSSPLTSCLRDCGVPPVAQDGYYILTDFDNTTEEATAELVCCEGFNTSITVTITCEDTAQGWSSPAESCTKTDCGKSLPTVDNGTYVANDGTEFGDVAVLVCDDGYTPTSTETCISCLYTGSWSSPLSSCQRDCGVPPVAEDGYYILTDTDNTTEGATAELTCCEGYNTSMTVTIICEDTEQGWSDPAETCTEIDCGSVLPSVNNGTYVANDGTEFGDVAVLVCDDGYTPLSTETCISCLYTGSWSSPLTSCLRDCGVPPVAQDGYYILTDTDNTTEEATAELICCEGFNTSMTITIICEDTDQGWSDPAESCTKIDCGSALPTVNNGTYVANDGTEFGDVAVLVCDDGYTPMSTETCISCLYTGSWSSPLTSCQRDCGVPPVAQDGFYTLTDSDNTTVGSTAELTCCEGFNTSMTVTIICEDTDQGWSDPAETCTRIECSNLPEVANGSFVPQDGVTVGSKALLVCDEGFAASSDDTSIVCEFDGSYSTANANCITDCGVFPTTPTGYFFSNSTDTTRGATADLVCCPGFSTNETVTITCEEDGWSSPNETCAAGCPSIEWLQFETSCYLFGSTQIAYQAAREFCDLFDNEVYDGNLVQVDTTEELGFLKNEMLTRSLQPDNGYWNDLFQLTTNGNEVWRTTGDALVVSDWNPGTGEPNDAGGRQSCTAFFRNFQYRQVDIQCENSVVDDSTIETDGLPFFPLCEVWIG